MTRFRPCPSCKCQPIEHWNGARKTAQVLCDECRRAGPEVPCRDVDDDAAWDLAGVGWDELVAPHTSCAERS